MHNSAMLSSKAILHANQFVHRVAMGNLWLGQFQVICIFCVDSLQEKHVSTWSIACGMRSVQLQW